MFPRYLASKLPTHTQTRRLTIRIT